MTLSSDAKRDFIRYSWPGNLRELSNVIERGVILAGGDEIDSSCLPDEHAKQGLNNSAIRPGGMVTLEELEDEHIRLILDRSKSLDEAAKTLGIDTTTLYRKRKRKGLV